MVRLGMWMVLGALACLFLTFVPAWTNEAQDFRFAADTAFCANNGQAVLFVNLSEAALAKGTLNSVVTGFCVDSSGQRTGTIPNSRFENVLIVLGLVAAAGVLVLFVGLIRRARGKQAAATTQAAAAVDAATVASNQAAAARSRQRNDEDVQAKRHADQQRQASPNQQRPAPAAPMTDWLAGGAVHDTDVPSARFNFDETGPTVPDTNVLIQLNQLQLAYESGLIMRSEYDARRAALLKDDHSAPRSDVS